MKILILHLIIIGSAIGFETTKIIPKNAGEKLVAFVNGEEIVLDERKATHNGKYKITEREDTQIRVLLDMKVDNIWIIMYVKDEECHAISFAGQDGRWVQKFNGKLSFFERKSLSVSIEENHVKIISTKYAAYLSPHMKTNGNEKFSVILFNKKGAIPSRISGGKKVKLYDSPTSKLSVEEAQVIEKLMIPAR